MTRVTNLRNGKSLLRPARGTSSRHGVEATGSGALLRRVLCPLSSKVLKDAIKIDRIETPGYFLEQIRVGERSHER